jgi:APA family basic amino acid/polyamine antiporter
MVHNSAHVLFGGGGEVAALIVAATVLLALVGTTLACMNTAVRVSWAMAKDKELPSVLGLLHGRFATPYGGLAVLTVLSAAIGIYGVHTVDNLTQITLASNTGTFLVYGMTCLVAVVAFASRHDRHVVKHLVLPGLGLLMNVAELLGVVYLSIAAGGSSASDALKAIIVVVLWSALGLAWVLFNPNRHEARRLAHERREQRRRGTVAAS